MWSTPSVSSHQHLLWYVAIISIIVPLIVNITSCHVLFVQVRHLNNSALESGAIFQPGIGPFETQDEPIKRHAYYQWVPFVLFGQALFFYIPHMLWKSWEGKIRNHRSIMYTTEQSE